MFPLLTRCASGAWSGLPQLLVWRFVDDLKGVIRIHCIASTMTPSMGANVSLCRYGASPDTLCNAIDSHLRCRRPIAGSFREQHFGFFTFGEAGDTGRGAFANSWTRASTLRDCRTGSFPPWGHRWHPRKDEDQEEKSVELFLPPSARYLDGYLERALPISSMPCARRRWASALGLRVFNCSAPDTGYGNDTRYGSGAEAKWLEAVASGEIRSAFDDGTQVASSDATNIET